MGLRLGGELPDPEDDRAIRIWAVLRREVSRLSIWEQAALVQALRKGSEFRRLPRGIQEAIRSLARVG
jgi:hypothetical protein